MLFNQNFKIIEFFTKQTLDMPFQKIFNSVLVLDLLYSPMKCNRKPFLSINCTEFEHIKK